MIIIDGKRVASHFINEIRNIIKPNSKPHLLVIQVGNNPASNVYIKYKEKACQKVDFGFTHQKLDEGVTTNDLISLIHDINADQKISGYIIQLPLPEHINKVELFKHIDPSKDIDCFHPENVGLMAQGHPRYYPATPYGVIKLLDYYNIEVRGKTVVIVGKSDIVGKPLQLMLSDEFGLAATTISCDKYTKNLKDLTKIADILIVAAGVPNLIADESWVKDGVVVIDVGINRLNCGKLCGDVNFEEVKNKCSYITPVPGGVGPMTVATLVYNVALSATQIKN